MLKKRTINNTLCQSIAEKTPEINPVNHYDPIPKKMLNGLRVAELFAGGGLMGVGLKAAGFDIIWANEMDNSASIAYQHNLGNHMIQADITKIRITDIPEIDVIAGGPPCQAFSIAGKGLGVQEIRGKPIWKYVEIIEAKQPKAFIFENVKGILSSKHKIAFEEMINRLQHIGFNVTWQLINSWDYGVAQKRERVFVVGIRKDLGFSYEFPKPSVDEFRTQTLLDVIGDLPGPSLESNIPNHNNQNFWYPKSDYAFSQANRVQKMDDPSNTIPAHHNSGQPQHPTQAPRRFTVRECLRIQSVPDSYIIPDTISLSSSYRIVGNGVSSRVAWILGQSLAAQLCTALHAKKNNHAYQLKTEDSQIEVAFRYLKEGCQLIHLERMGFTKDQAKKMSRYYRLANKYNWNENQRKKMQLLGIEKTLAIAPMIKRGDFDFIEQIHLDIPLKELRKKVRDALFNN